MARLLGIWYGIGPPQTARAIPTGHDTVAESVSSCLGVTVEAMVLLGCLADYATKLMRSGSLPNR